jgi:hypothetical protein
MFDEWREHYASTVDEQIMQILISEEVELQ